MSPTENGLSQTAAVYGFLKKPWFNAAGGTIP